MQFNTFNTILKNYLMYKIFSNTATKFAILEWMDFCYSKMRLIYILAQLKIGSNAGVCLVEADRV